MNDDPLSLGDPTGTDPPRSDEPEPVRVLRETLAERLPGLGVTSSHAERDDEVTLSIVLHWPGGNGTIDKCIITREEREASRGAWQSVAWLGLSLALAESRLSMFPVAQRACLERLNPLALKMLRDDGL